MAGPEKKAVEIGIVADVADLKTGAKEGAAAIREVGAAAEDSAKQLGATSLSAEGLAKLYAEANAKSAEWAETLRKLSNEQLLEVEERLREQIKLQQELGQNTDDLKQKLGEAYNQRTNGLEDALAKTASGGRDAARASGELAGKLREVTGAAKGTREVFEGLEQGGIGGLIKSGKGLRELFHSIAGGALTGAFIPAVLAAGAAILALRRHGEKLEEENKKAFEAQAKRSEELKAAYEQIAATAKKTAEEQIAAIEKVVESYDVYLARLEKGDARLKESVKLQTEAKAAQVDLEEQRALSAARTPEDRDKVAKQFEQQRSALKGKVANAEIIDSANNARLRLDTNAEEESAIQSKRDAVQRNLDEKRKADQDARDGLRDLINTQRREGKSLASSPEIIAAQDIAKKAARELREAEKENEEVQRKSRIDSEKIGDQNAAAAAQLDNARLRGERRIAEIETDTAKRLNESKPERERLKKEAADALERGDIAAQDKAVKQLQALERLVATATAENTRAIRDLTAALSGQRGLAAPAPRTENIPPPPEVKLKGDSGSGDAVIEKDGTKIQLRRGELVSPRAKEATVTIDGVQQSLDSALKESRAKDVAFVTFANTVADDSKATRKQVEKAERQIANSR